jgi:hypothetical protein
LTLTKGFDLAGLVFNLPGLVFAVVDGNYLNSNCSSTPISRSAELMIPTNSL